MTHAECSDQDANRAGPPACPPRSCFLSCSITSSPSRFAPLSFSLAASSSSSHPFSPLVPSRLIRPRVRISNRFQQAGQHSTTHVYEFYVAAAAAAIARVTRPSLTDPTRKNSSGDRVDCYICWRTWSRPIPGLRLVSRLNGPAKRRLTRARVESARATLIECPAKARSLPDNNSPRTKR